MVYRMKQKQDVGVMLVCVAVMLLATLTASAQEIQSLEHDTSNGEYNAIVQVDSDTYLLAYAGSNDDGFIKTFTIPADGSTITEVQSLEHDLGFGIRNTWAQVGSDNSTRSLMKAVLMPVSSKRLPFRPMGRRLLR